MSSIRIALSSAAVAGLVVLSGCAGLPDSPTVPQTTVTDQPSPSESTMPGDAGDTTEPKEPSPTATVASPSTEPSPSATPAEQPFAVRPGAIDTVRVKASVYPVRRAGQTATVNVMIAADNPGEAFTLNGELSDGNPEVGSRSDRAVDGLRLVDVINKKAHLPATTGDGICACIPTDNADLSETNVVWVSVVFAAPPAELTTISVQIPQFGTITDVPLV